MKLSEKIQEALREQQEINLSDPAVQKRLAAQWGYVPAGVQPATILEGWQLVPRRITEQMHVAACKEIVRSDGLDGLPQRMLDAMLAPAPSYKERSNG